MLYLFGCRHGIFCRKSHDVADESRRVQAFESCRHTADGIAAATEIAEIEAQQRHIFLYALEHNVV